MRYEPGCRAMHQSFVMPLNNEAVIQSMLGRLAVPSHDVDGAPQCQFLPIMATRSSGYPVYDEYPRGIVPEEFATNGALSIMKRAGRRIPRESRVEAGNDFPQILRMDGWSRDLGATTSDPPSLTSTTPAR